jgi:phosphate transport system protein
VLVDEHGCSPTVHGAFTGRHRLVTLSAYRVHMREAFHEQLDSIFHDLAEICDAVETSVRLATQALLNGDAEVAEAVIAADDKVDRARERVEDTAFSLLSLQQPVAGDLRVVVSALRIVSELERMGDLSVHVAKIARLRVPDVAVPQDARPTIARMGDVAEDMVRRVSAVITERDVEAAIALGRDDEEMDQLRRTSFTQLLGDNWQHGVESAVDIALLGRYYERIADHAVSVANRVVFVVTGQFPVASEA